MFIVFLRTVILYTLVVIIVRLMGKRQIGELQPYELVVTIMISDLAALPMQDTRLPLLLGVIPIITLLFVKNIISTIQLKSQITRKIIDGEPCILIKQGKINYSVLKTQQISIDELMEELRLSGYFDLRTIEYAILENNGKLSVLEKSKDSKVPELPKILITDGELNINSLTTRYSDEPSVLKILEKYDIDSINKVMLAMFDTDGNFYYQLFEENKGRKQT